MAKLAILGGEKIRKKLFPAYNVLDGNEINAVTEVIKSEILSKYLGAWHEDFYGGEQVRALEEEWQTYFGVKHAIAVNSATSGLYCAVGAIGVGPGDEVIVSPYTMCASATAALIYNAVPVFADIEKDYFCLDYESIESRITERTKAIIVVDIFGQPYDRKRINAIAKKHNIIVIEDAAQAPFAKYDSKFAGTLGDIGVYSFNYHKHIHCGEGGMIVTDNDELAENMRLIRNHAEAVVGDKGYSTLVNMIGFNYRMTEINAAIIRSQLKKLEILIIERRNNVSYIENKLKEIPCLEMPKLRPNTEHAYYLHALKYDEHIAGIPRKLFVDAVRAELMPIEKRESEGIKVSEGYVKPLYLLPLYQQKVAYGKEEIGCPFKCPVYKGKINYEKGICPNCEMMYEKKLIIHELMKPGMTKSDLDDAADAFIKVWENIEALR